MRPYIALSCSLHQFLLLLRPRTVGINAALDLRQSLLVLLHHSQDRNDSADHDRAYRNQKYAETQKLLYDFLHAASPFSVLSYQFSVPSNTHWQLTTGN